MPIVDKEVFEADQIPTAAELNSAYNALSSASSSIDAENQAAGWLTFKHLQNPDGLTPINKLYQYAYDGTGVTSYNNDVSYTPVVNPAATPCTVTLGYTAEQNEIIRIHISGITEENDVVEDYDFVGANLGKPNYYAFRIKLRYSDSGGADQFIFPGYWAYSFTTNGLNRYNTFAAQPGLTINYQTFQASTIFKNTAATGVRLWKDATLEVKLFDGSNTLKIIRHQIQVVRAKR
jgi:hypothetical protein